MNSDRKVGKEPVGFIDGDFVELFLDLDKDTMNRIVAGEEGGTALDRPLEETLSIIEELARLH